MAVTIASVVSVRNSSRTMEREIKYTFYIEAVEANVQQMCTRARKFFKYESRRSFFKSWTGHQVQKAWH